MSYDITLEICTGGQEPAIVAEVGNYSSNYRRAWQHALGEPLADLDRRAAWTCTDQLAGAVKHMLDGRHEADYLALLTPANGDTILHAAACLSGLQAACVRHPNAAIRIRS